MHASHGGDRAPSRVPPSSSLPAGRGGSFSVRTPTDRAAGTRFDQPRIPYTGSTQCASAAEWFFAIVGQGVSRWGVRSSTYARSAVAKNMGASPNDRSTRSAVSAKRPRSREYKPLTRFRANSRHSEWRTRVCLEEDCGQALQIPRRHARIGISNGLDPLELIAQLRAEFLERRQQVVAGGLEYSAPSGCCQAGACLADWGAGNRSYASPSPGAQGPWIREPAFSRWFPP